MPLFLRCLLQAVSDWALQRALERQGQKIRLVERQKIDDDVKRAAVEQAKRQQEKMLEDYLRRP